MWRKRFIWWGLLLSLIDLGHGEGFNASHCLISPRQPVSLPVCVRLSFFILSLFSSLLSLSLSVQFLCLSLPHFFSISLFRSICLFALFSLSLSLSCPSFSPRFYLEVSHPFSIYLSFPCLSLSLPFCLTLIHFLCVFLPLSFRLSPLLFLIFLSVPMAHSSVPCLSLCLFMSLSLSLSLSHSALDALLSKSTFLPLSLSFLSLTLHRPICLAHLLLLSLHLCICLTTFLTSHLFCLNLWLIFISPFSVSSSSHTSSPPVCPYVCLSFSLIPFLPSLSVCSRMM